MKALPNPHILRILKEENCGVDCSSECELLLAEKAGFSGDHIMFSANAMPPAEFAHARALNAIVNLDDITDIETLRDNGGIPEEICLRFNPGGNFQLNNSIMGNPGDSKYGWMMQDERSMKLTVVHSPKFYFRNDSVQGMLDFGLNRYGYAIYSHKGAVDSNVQLYARFFNQPVTAFVTDKHAGKLGSELSFCSISNSNVIVRAIKKAENSDEIIVRFNEGVNLKAEKVEFTIGNGIESAREVNAMEDNIGEAVVSEGKLIFDIDPFDVKSFALKLRADKATDAISSTVVELPFSLKATTSNDNPGESKIPYINVAIPEEIFPDSIECGGIKFRTSDKKENALICNGQKISVKGKKLYLIAASLKNDRPCTFRVGDRDVTVKVQAINERIARWDLYNLEEAADIKTDRFAWECTHSHNTYGDIAAAQLFFFMYEIDISGADSVTFPDDDGLMIIAASQTDDDSCIKLITPLYDRVQNRNFDFRLSAKEKILDRLHKIIEKKTPNKS